MTTLAHFDLIPFARSHFAWVRMTYRHENYWAFSLDCKTLVFESNALVTARPVHISAEGIS